jgi:hypothetical protein
MNVSDWLPLLTTDIISSHQWE